MATAVAASPAVSPRIESASQTAKENFQIAAKKLRLEPEMQTLLRTPMREMTVEIPVRMDDGSMRVFGCARVQHNGVRGPVMGGMRYHPAADIELTRALAEITTWKNAVVAIPFGGASGGVRCEPTQLSDAELERLTRQFTSRIHMMLGAYCDVSMPEVNSSSREMNWISEEYCRVHGYAPAAVTGKPLDRAGSPGREQASARGLAIILREAARTAQLPLEGLRVAIQGYGSADAQLRTEIEALDCTVIMMPDAQNGVLSHNELKKHSAKRRSSNGVRSGKPVENSEILACDVLVLAGLDTALTASNAEQVRAKLVLEAADLAITPEADAILEKRGITVIPDLLANAGGVTASYFEWAQNLQQIVWTEEHVSRQLEVFLTRAYQNVIKRAKKDEVSLRTAAYSLGIERVARSERLRAK
jgi:glutamate dehydrogenase (NAD(P)+)